jgi:2,3-dihydroxybenzoate-AMP ligase
VVAVIGFTEFPSEFAERYRREGYWTGETLGVILRDWAASNPERTALVTPERRWTYAELDARADRVASGFHRLGVRPGDRVVVQLPNDAPFVIVSVALFRLGAYPVFALPNHRRSEINYLCDYSGAVAYVIPAEYQGFDYRTLADELLKSVPTVQHVIVTGGDPQAYRSLVELEAEPVAFPSPDSNDVAFFLLSGGTTGMPKLIPRTHNEYAYQLRATAAGLNVDESSVYLASLPVAHNAALGCPGLLGTLLVGGKVVLPTSGSPDEVFPLIASEGVTLTTLMPPLVLLWLETAEFFDVDLSNFILQVGGAKLGPEVARRVGPELGCTLTHWFGMAEGLLTFTRLDDPDDVAIHTQGRPLSRADEIRVVDNSGNDVPRGEIGELLTRGPYTLRGYYKADAHNAVSFTPDGFFRSGDLVRITPEGNMVVEGRIKDIINRGGEKVSAEELEDHLLAHPNIRRAAVVEMPDEVLGEKTCAFVVPGEARPDLNVVRAFLRERGLADYKLPDRLEVIETLPYTSVGKINKARLREVLAQALGPAV